MALGFRLPWQKISSKFDQRDIKAAEDWLPVDSSNVKAICWRLEGEGRRHGLGVWFAPVDKKTGKRRGAETTYWYPAAPFEEYKAMRSAASKGTYLHEHIIGKYPHVGPFGAGG